MLTWSLVPINSSKDSQVAELVDAYINEWTACHWGGAKKVTHTGSNPVLTTKTEALRNEELFLFNLNVQNKQNYA